jgi:PadR family transcriptional regulator PadR
MDFERAGRKFQKELNAGAISLVLLGVLRERRKPMYGYEIAKQLESLADGPLPMNQGALYPVLRSLEKQGMLLSQVEPSATGPPRRYYRMTKAGKEALDDWVGVWQRTKQFVDSVLEGRRGRQSGTPGSQVPRSSRA